MKTKRYIINTLSLLMTGLTLFFACQEEEEADPPLPRLFQPILAKAVITGDKITVEMTRMEGTVSYTVAASTDTFKTTDLTIESETNIVELPLLWEQTYQVSAIAHADDPSHDSKLTILGNITTADFPTILKKPGTSDVTDVAARMSWSTNDGAPITSVKVCVNNRKVMTVLREIPITPAEVTAQEKIVYGLNPSTTYLIYLYSGDIIRGWKTYTTKPAFKAPPGATVVDLRGIAKVSILADTIFDIPSGSVIVLEKGRQYTIATGTALTKTVTIQSGLDFNPNPPKVFLSSNFTFASGSNVDSVVFKDLYMYSDSYTGKYVFNISNACTVGKVKFESCKMEIFRGVFRTQGAVAVNISNYMINNCVIDSVMGYGIITVDNVSNKVDNISIKNSTIYKTERIIVSRQNSNSVTIENCTINEAPITAGFLIDYNTSPTNVVATPIVISNCIFGPGKYNGALPITLNGVRVNATTVIVPNNLYSTSEYTTSNAASTTKIAGITGYTGTSFALFKNPKAGDFTIKDANFTGRSSAGDPRWRLK